MSWSTDVAQHLADISAPTYLVFGTADEYVSTENREALVRVAGPNVNIDIFDGYSHSAWTAAQADDIIDRSVNFLTGHRVTDRTGSDTLRCDG